MFNENLAEMMRQRDFVLTAVASELGVTPGLILRGKKDIAFARRLCFGVLHDAFGFNSYWLSRVFHCSPSTASKGLSVVDNWKIHPYLYPKTNDVYQSVMKLVNDYPKDYLKGGEK